MKNWNILKNALGGWKIEIFLDNALGWWKIKKEFESCARRMKNRNWWFSTIDIGNQMF